MTIMGTVPRQESVRHVPATTVPRHDNDAGRYLVAVYANTPALDCARLTDQPIMASES